LHLVGSWVGRESQAPDDGQKIARNMLS